MKSKRNQSPLRLIANGATALAALAGVSLAGACATDGTTDLRGTCAATQADTSSVGIRLYLLDTVLHRLQQRAAANDPAWVTLKTRCDGLAGGTFYPPSGNAYPDFPNVGQGYQGEDYMPEIMNLGLCYRVIHGLDAAAEARYGAAGARLLQAMSTPVASGGQPPKTDDGYGIRNYGVGMATGYDWLRPALSDTVKQAVIASLNTWIDWYDTSGFSRNDPIGNYFAGYLLAKTTTALATEGDNPKAAGYWSDVQTRLWGQIAQPKFTASLRGGGWPEGWQYGPLSIAEISQFLWAVKTAKGLDWWSSTPGARDQASYLRNFAWPSLRHMDDQGTVHSQTALRPSTSAAIAMAGMLEHNGDPAAAIARSFAADLIAANGAEGDPWQRFLYWDDSLPKSPYTAESNSYFAPGPNHVAVRSSWDKAGVWGTFVSGAYIDAPDSGEQYFNQGAVAIVRGDQPILVNGTGWLPQAAGDPGETYVYDDTWSQQTRLLNNTFYAAGAKQDSVAPPDSKTHVERYEERGVFVRARGANIADMYAHGPGVTQFTRDFVYVRPETFIVYDRTTVGQTADQWLAWHTAVQPVSTTVADATQRRYDVKVGGAIAGSVRTLLPRNAAAKTVSILSGAVWRLETHGATTAAVQDWLTVISAGSAVPEQVRLSSDDGNVPGGGVVGVHVLAARNAIVLFNSDHAGVATTPRTKYVVAQTADADHMLFDMAPSASGYAVTATLASGKLTIDVAPGGPFTLTAQGTLAFTMSPSGNAAAPPPPPPPPPGGGGSDGGAGGDGSDAGGAGGSGGGNGNGTGNGNGAGGADAGVTGPKGC